MHESCGCHASSRCPSWVRLFSLLRHALDLPWHPVPSRTKRPSEFQARHHRWSFHGVLGSRLVGRERVLRRRLSLLALIQRTAEFANENRQFRWVHFFTGFFCEGTPILISTVRGHSGALHFCHKPSYSWSQDRG